MGKPIITDRSLTLGAHPSAPALPGHLPSEGRLGAFYEKGPHRKVRSWGSLVQMDIQVGVGHLHTGFVELLLDVFGDGEVGVPVFVGGGPHPQGVVDGAVAAGD